MATTAFQAPPLPLRPAHAARLPLARPARPAQPTRRVSCPAMIATRRARAGLTTVLGGEEPTPRVRVEIEAPARNKRRVSACNLIAAPLATVWELLADYDRLSEFIPNLALSVQRPHPAGGIRVEQCGAQSILGFEFRASLVMDMTEVNKRSEEWRAIEFALVSSRDFAEFEGVWQMESVGENKTALYYSVSIVPRGLVPVRAIEWRISEDVPGNMDAVREECERRRRNAVADLRRNRMSNCGRDS